MKQARDIDHRKEAREEKRAREAAQQALLVESKRDKMRVEEFDQRCKK